MLVRITNFFDFFSLDFKSRQRGQRIAAAAAARANGMTHLKDYEALAAILLYHRPNRIFEIGTYLGVTSDFFLELLPECRVVSIAYTNASWNPLRRFYNNSDLARYRIGSCVAPQRRSRFEQIYGDSHKLRPEGMIQQYGRFDFVMVDGDHSLKGVMADTLLANAIINDSGVVCWHDANPKPKYADVKHYLEGDKSINAVATEDTFVGGVACLSKEVVRLLRELSETRPLSYPVIHSAANV